MSGVRRHELKVLEPIVGPDLVSVMNDLLASEHPSEAGSHHEAMLKHVPLRVSHRMILTDLDSNVSADVARSSASPAAAVLKPPCATKGSETFGRAVVIRRRLKSLKLYGECLSTDVADRLVVFVVAHMGTSHFTTDGWRGNYVYLEK